MELFVVMEMQLIANKQTISRIYIFIDRELEGG